MLAPLATTFPSVTRALRAQKDTYPKNVSVSTVTTRGKLCYKNGSAGGKIQI